MSRHEKALTDAHETLEGGGEGFLGSDQAEALLKEREEMFDLLKRAYLYMGDREMAPDGDWLEQYYNLLGVHRVLVEDDYGRYWLSPKDAKHHDADQIIREINATEGS